MKTNKVNSQFLWGILAGIFISGVILVVITTSRKSTDSQHLLNSSNSSSSLAADPATDQCSNTTNAPSEGVAFDQKVDQNNSNKGKININTASAANLELLPGIGPEKAKAILKFRNSYGNFLSIDELNYVPGISEKVFNQLHDLVTTCSTQ
jgi:comEA protein